MGALVFEVSCSSSGLYNSVSQLNINFHFSQIILLYSIWLKVDSSFKECL